MAGDGSGGEPVRKKWARERESVRWSPRVGEAICRRVSSGELLYVVLREPGMPTPQTVGRWIRAKPEFRAALAAARAACGRTEVGGGVFTYNEGLGREVYGRLCDGESLTAIGRDPTMPCLSTLFHWRRRLPEFETTVQTGVRVRAERVCDEGWEAAQAATPETAYLTHVRLTHMRWMAGVMAPRTYRLKTVEPETPTESRRLLMRRFTIETDPETGQKTVIGWCPNPDTGEAEREDTPGWRQAPDSMSLPGGRIG